MNAILICPSTRPGVEHLSSYTPLAAIPLLGESLVEYWLSHLAMSGASEVQILANDRPQHIAAIVGNGARWGLKADVIAESRELTLAQAQIKYAREITSGTHEIAVLDHFPGSIQSLFTSYADLFSGLFEWLPNARMPDRIGLKEVKTGVWVGLQTRISPTAQIHPPCWIGQNVYIGTGAVIGPMAVIEDRSFVEANAQVIGSLVGPDTYVGQDTVIQDAFALGNMLINWKSNLFTHVVDAFILSALRRPMFQEASGNMFDRLTQIYSRNKDELQTFWKHMLLDKEHLKRKG
jgi:UDP-3-O-[3-hydroxymyristoyl] glucosamine N-acyltransferase